MAQQQHRQGSEGPARHVQPSTNFAARRQERMRGAGKHSILPSTYPLFQRQNNDGRRSSSSTATSTSSSQIASTSASSSSSRSQTPVSSRQGNGALDSTPLASSVAGSSSARIIPNSSSPSRYIDPRLLADRSHHRIAPVAWNWGDAGGGADGNGEQGTPSARGDKEIRRLERMRGAGVYQIQQRPVQFPQGTPGSDSSVSIHIRDKSIAGSEYDPSPKADPRWLEKRRLERRKGAGIHQIVPRPPLFLGSSPGTDSFRHSIDESTRDDIAPSDPIHRSSDQSAHDDWIERRRVERLRGAGTHAIHKQPVQFSGGVPDGDSTLMSDRTGGDVNEGTSGLHGINGEDWLERRRQERRRGAGTYMIEEQQVVFQGDDSSHASASCSVLDPGMTPGASFQHGGDDEGYDDDTIVTVNGVDDLSRDLPMNSTMTGTSYANDQYPAASNEQDPSNASIAISSQSTKRRAEHGLHQPIKAKVAKRAYRPTPRTINGKAAAAAFDALMGGVGDETVMGQADETLVEQRGVALTASDPPSWTFPKRPLTSDELKAMKERVSKMMTLGLGDTMTTAHHGNIINDADVLWREVQIAIKSIQKQKPARLHPYLQQLETSLLASFRHLSIQSAERLQLINNLNEARNRNKDLRLEVFHQRSHVLKVQRTTRILREQEVRRLQKEEDEEKSLTFLRRLDSAASDWC